MQLRIQSLSPFCRKVLAAVRVRRDPVEILEVDSPFGAGREALGAVPMLLTDEGAWTGSASIVATLEARRSRPAPLVPPALVCEIGDLDRILDLYLLEPAITMACSPGTPAAVRSVYTALRTLDLLEDRLSDGRRHLVGEALTLVDLTAVIGITDVQRQSVPIPDSLLAWARRQVLHPALRDVVDEADAAFELRGALDEGLSVEGLRAA